MRIQKTVLLTLCLTLGLTAALALPARAANTSGRTSVLDAQENQYSATTILETASGSRIRTVKRDSFGGIYWAKDFTSSRSLVVGQIRVDGSGNVYIVATQLATASAAPIYTLLKYTSTGTLSWSKTYTDSTFRLGGVARALALDSSGNPYVLLWGTSTTAGTSSRLLKYNSAGTNLFTKNIQPQSNTYLDSLRIDSSNNLYISGEADTGSGSGNLFLARYDTSGNQIWQRLDAVGPLVLVTDLALDGSNQPVAVTSSTGSTTSTLFAEKVTAAGVLVWSSTVSSGGFQPTGVIVDASGAVAVTGNDYGNSIGDVTTGYHVARLDGSTGAVLWNVIWSATSTYVTAIAEEASHTSYLTSGEDINLSNSTVEIRVPRFNETDGSNPIWFFYDVTQENHAGNVLPSSVVGDFYVTGRAFASGNLYPLNWKVSGTSEVYDWIQVSTH